MKVKHGSGDDMEMDYELTRHTIKVMAERGLSAEVAGARLEITGTCRA
jgi:hypothetical protein